MPKTHNCFECGRPIKRGNETKLNGRYYGSECIHRQVDKMNVKSSQEEWDFTLDQALALMEDSVPVELVASPENKDLTN